MITNLIINSLLCLGFFVITREGKLLSFIPRYYDKIRLLLGSKISSDKWRCRIVGMWDEIEKPLMQCLVCMASVWGCVYYFVFDLDFSLYILVPYCIMLSALNYLMSFIYDLIESSYDK